MTILERLEYAKLSRLWAINKATMRQIIRCMELSRQAAAESKAVTHCIVEDK